MKLCNNIYIVLFILCASYLPVLGQETCIEEYDHTQIPNLPARELYYADDDLYVATWGGGFYKIQDEAVEKIEAFEEDYFSTTGITDMATFNGNLILPFRQYSYTEVYEFDTNQLETEKIVEVFDIIGIYDAVAMDSDYAYSTSLQADGDYIFMGTNAGLVILDAAYNLTQIEDINGDGVTDYISDIKITADNVILVSINSGIYELNPATLELSLFLETDYYRVVEMLPLYNGSLIISAAKKGNGATQGYVFEYSNGVLNMISDEEFIYVKMLFGGVALAEYKNDAFIALKDTLYKIENSGLQAVQALGSNLLYSISTNDESMAIGTNNKIIIHNCAIECDAVIDVCGVCGGSGVATWYADTDGDGFGNANESITNCEQPEGYVANDSDADDTVFNCTFDEVSTSVVCDESEHTFTVFVSLPDGNYAYVIDSDTTSFNNSFSYTGGDIESGFNVLLINTDTNCELQINNAIDCTTTAIDLLSFEGRATENNNQLFWTTASETDNAYFEVFRSIDGVNFDVIGKVTGAGNSTTPQAYNFTDTDVLATTTYYRLEAVDNNGEISASSVIALQRTVLSAPEVSLLPNPANEFITLSFSHHSATDFSINIFDIQGKLILSESAVNVSNNGLTIDVSTYQTGVYFLQLMNNETVQQLRFVVD